jgi:hypothetical protein
VPAGETIEDRLRRSLGGEPSAEIVARARTVRDQTIANADASGASVAAHEELQRRDLRRVAAAGDVVALLDALADKGTPMPEIAADRARMETLLRHPAKGPTISRSDLKDLGREQDGTTIRLGVGTFEWPHVDGVAAGVTVEGVGVDQTRIGGDMEHLRDSLVAFTAQDLTLTGQDVFDTHGKLLTVTLRRVRAVGFNTGAGGSGFLDVRSAPIALLAEDCTFDGAGRGPAHHGIAFSLSTRAKLLRFERCTFVGLDTPLQTWGSVSAVFDHCTFRDNARAHVEGAVYKDCVFEGNADDPK